jgi:hypothetical protein
MQIDRYNHLLFPRDANTTGNSNHNAAATGKDASPSAAASGVLARPQAGGLAPGAARAAGRPEGVVLKIQWPDGAQAASDAAEAAVYANGRPMVAAGDTADADTDAMARDHQLAVDRNAGSFTRISLNKDGVLVANKTQQAPAPDKQPDFVALAVSAMREYSDEHERQKVRATPSDTAAATPAEAQWGAFKGLQQFAAKLNVFA